MLGIQTANRSALADVEHSLTHVLFASLTMIDAEQMGTPKSRWKVLVATIKVARWAARRICGGPSRCPSLSADRAQALCRGLGGATGASPGVS
jgi:hypothetical protein